MRRYLELANEWETPRIRVFGGNLAPGQTESEGVDLLAESLNRLAPDAERAGGHRLASKRTTPSPPAASSPT